MECNDNAIDLTTRRYMRAEVLWDARERFLATPPDLSQRAAGAWLEVLVEAVSFGSAASLAEALRTIEARTHVVPDAVGTLPPSEELARARDAFALATFHMYYVRAVCRTAIESGVDRVEVFWNAPDDHPDASASAAIGRRMDPAKMLGLLRRGQGVPDAVGATGLPPSCLSVRIPT